MTPNCRCAVVPVKKTGEITLDDGTIIESYEPVGDDRSRADNLYPISPAIETNADEPIIIAPGSGGAG